MITVHENSFDDAFFSVESVTFAKEFFSLTQETTPVFYLLVSLHALCGASLSCSATSFIQSKAPFIYLPNRFLWQCSNVYLRIVSTQSNAYTKLSVWSYTPCDILASYMVSYEKRRLVLFLMGKNVWAVQHCCNTTVCSRKIDCQNCISFVYLYYLICFIPLFDYKLLCGSRFNPCLALMCIQYNVSW